MESWREFATYGDAASAEVIAGLLRSEDVPARIVSDEPMPGLIRGFSVLVAPEMLHRARWILSQAQLSDAELSYYATGRLGEDDSNAP
jgi:hypothetical protein